LNPLHTDIIGLMPHDIHHTTNPFATFADFPQGVAFEGQEKGEKIILLLRAHLITLVPRVFTIIFLLILPFFAPFILGLSGIDLAGFLSAAQTFLIVVFWYLFTFGFALYRFIFWYFNVYLLTNERVVDFDFKGLLHKETAYAKLNQVQDVSPKMIGFFGTFFHYGNIYIQTAAERPEFEFHNVENPNMVAQEIHEQVRKEEAEPPGVIA